MPPLVPMFRSGNTPSNSHGQRDRIEWQSYRTATPCRARTRSKQSSASRTVDQMLATGLVTRRNGAQDQRRREVALTREGLALLRKVWPKVAQRADRLTEGIAREDIDLCARVLSRMIDNVAAQDP